MNESKLYLYFCHTGKKHIFWRPAEFQKLVCVPRDEEVGTCCSNPCSYSPQPDRDTELHAELFDQFFVWAEKYLPAPKRNKLACPSKNIKVIENNSDFMLGRGKISV